MTVARVLVTAFDRFLGHAVNSSELVVEALGERVAPGVVCKVLPTQFRRAGEQVESFIVTERPEVVLLLGMASGASALRLERRALNRDAARGDDNAGERRAGAIVVGGPDEYRSTLPLERFAQAVRDAGVPVEFSDDAGGFVCNHVFYRARHCIEAKNPRILCGFVHVPAIEPAQLSPWVRAIEACLAIVEARATQRVGA